MSRFRGTPSERQRTPRGLPVGGRKGELLGKVSLDDFDVDWLSPNWLTLDGGHAGTDMTGVPVADVEAGFTILDMGSA